MTSTTKDVEGESEKGQSDDLHVAVLAFWFSGSGNHSRGNISKAIQSITQCGALHSGRGQNLTGEAKEQLGFKLNISYRKILYFSLGVVKEIMNSLLEILDFSVLFDRRSKNPSPDTFDGKLKLTIHRKL